MSVERRSFPAFFPHLGFRLRLSLALGFVALLVIIVAAIAVLDITRLHQETDHAISVDGRLSRLSSQIAIKALQSRRYEKDYLLNVRSRDIDSYLKRWKQSNAELAQAIDAYEAVAQSPEDRQRINAWHVQLASYEKGIDRVEQQVTSGIIEDEQTARTYFANYQSAISLLSDEVVVQAEKKDQEAQSTAVILGQNYDLAVKRVIGLAAVTTIFALLWCILFPIWLARPMRELSTAVQRVADGDLDTRTGITRRDEFGTLARTFDHMASVIQQNTRDLQSQYSRTEAARAEAVAVRAKLSEQLETIEAQQATIREMSVPILPLNERTLVMPLIGALDSARLVIAQEAALRAIEQSRALSLILDITGVPIVDTQVAQGLIRIVQAAQLLGCRVMVVGIRPEVAQSIVGLGVDLGEITTFSSLQNSLDVALSKSRSRFSAN